MTGPIPDKPEEIADALARSARVGYPAEDLVEATRLYFESLPTAEQVGRGLLAFGRRPPSNHRVAG